MKIYELGNLIAFLGSNETDLRGQQFLSAMRQELSSRGTAMRTLNINADDSAFESVMNPTKENCIIPAT